MMRLFRLREFRLGFTKRIDAGLVMAILLTLFASQALLQPGLPTSADLAIHLHRTAEFERAWAPGVIVPRWAPNLAFGYGYPLFVFAPPLPYLLALIFDGAGLSLENAFKLVMILTLALYAAGMYLLVRDLFRSSAAGLVAAAAYAFSPFALREALLSGGNIPQLLAIGLFPWPLWAVTRAVQSGSLGWGWTILAAFFYASIMLSHLFHAFVFTPVLGLYSLLMVGWAMFASRAGLGSEAQTEFGGQRGSQTEFGNQASPSSGSRTELGNQASPSSGSRTELGNQASPSSGSRTEFGNQASPSSGSQTEVGNQSGGKGFWLFRIPGLSSPLAVPLGLLLSAFFWLPAFTERYFTRAQAEIYLEKSPFFIRYPYLPELLAWIYPLDSRAANPYTPLSLGVVTLGLAGIGLGVVLAGPVARRLAGQTPDLFVARDKLAIYSIWAALFFAGVAGGASLMALPLSRPVWETVSILQVAEFPWRMLGLANLGLAVLAGAAVLAVPQRWRGWVTAGCLGVQLAAIGPLLYPVTGFTRYGEISLSDQIRYEQSSQSIGTTTLGEYLPQTVGQPPTGSPLVAEFEAGRVPQRLDRESLPPAAEATLLEQSATTHRYYLETDTAFTLRLFHYVYPGWRAELDGRPVAITPEAESGLMLIEIPAGEHRLTVHFGETPGRIMALSLSALTVLGLAGVALAGYRRRRGRGETSAPRPAEAPGLWLKPSLFCGLSALIVLAALGLKPLLRPVFTLESPRDRVVPAQYPAEVRFENGIRLLGYDLSRRPFRPGSTVQVVLYWQTDDKEAISRLNLRPFVHLDRLQDFETVALSTNYTPGDVTTETVLPTFHWDNYRYIRDEHDLTIPREVAPQAYALRVGLIDPDQGGQAIPLAGDAGDTVWLDTLNVEPLEAPPPLSQPLEVVFRNDEDSIRLAGFQMGEMGAGHLEFTLAWRSEARPGRDYTVFTQLLDGEGRLVAGFDRPPLDGAYPTSTWLPGQTIHDPRRLPVEGVPPGQYRLIVGLYDSAGGQRLLAGEGNDFVALTTVTLNEK